MREVRGEEGENEKRRRQETEGQRVVEEVVVLEESQGVQLEISRRIKINLPHWCWLKYLGYFDIFN